MRMPKIRRLWPERLTPLRGQVKSVAQPCLQEGTAASSLIFILFIRAPSGSRSNAFVLKAAGTDFRPQPTNAIQSGAPASKRPTRCPPQTTRRQTSRKTKVPPQSLCRQKQQHPSPLDLDHRFVIHCRRQGASSHAKNTHRKPQYTACALPRRRQLSLNCKRRVAG